MTPVPWRIHSIRVNFTLRTQLYGNQYDEVNNDLPYGLVVRIPGFHPGGPGSIPGVGT